MGDFLLIGAGFSRNWGGWLASEVFEYLLGSPEVVRDANLRLLLWKHQEQGGGFEAALAELQTQFANDPAGSSKTKLNALQDAIKQMFNDMNRAFMAFPDWQFGQQDTERKIGTFLARFDAIFTLNQDLLLEHHYASGNIARIGKRQWSGCELPGMSRIQPDEPLHVNSWSHSTWTPLPKEEFKVAPRSQPIYKLHGSSNWTRSDGQDLLIMGGAKVREIGQTPILNWYAEKFEASLSAPGARLMVIGYGFRDDHINATISNAVERGLKLFIVSPEGADLGRRSNPTRAPGLIGASTPLEEMIKDSLIGASRRGLREIFSHDDAEFNKVMRFFAVPS